MKIEKMRRKILNNCRNALILEELDAFRKKFTEIGSDLDFNWASKTTKLSQIVIVSDLYENFAFS